MVSKGMRSVNELDAVVRAASEDDYPHAKLAKVGGKLSLIVPSSIAHGALLIYKDMSNTNYEPSSNETACELSFRSSGDSCKQVSATINGKRLLIRVPQFLYDLGTIEYYE